MMLKMAIEVLVDMVCGAVYADGGGCRDAEVQGERL